MRTESRLSLTREGIERVVRTWRSRHPGVLCLDDEEWALDDLICDVICEVLTNTQMEGPKLKESI